MLFHHHSSARTQSISILSLLTFSKLNEAQNSLGYLLPPKLFMIIAHPSRMSEVCRICGTYHQPMLETWGTETARRAVAPPGGWLRTAFCQLGEEEVGRRRGAYVISNSCMTPSERASEMAHALSVIRVSLASSSHGEKCDVRPVDSECVANLEARV